MIDFPKSQASSQGNEQVFIILLREVKEKFTCHEQLRQTDQNHDEATGRLRMQVGKLPV
jgi:hypothetical protein